MTQFPSLPTDIVGLEGNLWSVFLLKGVSDVIRLCLVGCPFLICSIKYLYINSYIQVISKGMIFISLVSNISITDFDKLRLVIQFIN